MSEHVTVVNYERVLGRILTGAAAALLLVLFILPPLTVAVAAFRDEGASVQGQWTLQPFFETLTRPSTWRVAANSLILATAASFFGLIVGAFLAWVAVKTTTPLRRTMTPTMLVLLMTPSLFYGLGWYLAVSGNAAPLNVALHSLFGVEGSPFASGWPTMLFVITGFIIPVAYIFMLGPMTRVDTALDDAARMSGASRVGAVFTITIPLLRPTLLGVFVLLVSYGFSAFELPLLFGIPADIQVFSTAVYTTLTAQQSTPNYAGASSLALLLMAMVIGLVLLRNALLRGRRFNTISGKSFQMTPKSYGGIQWLFLGVFVLTVLWCGVIPLSQMIIGSFQPMFGLAMGFTTVNWESVLNDASNLNLIGFTIAIAALGGLIAAFLALILAHMASRGGRALRGLSSTVTWAPVAIPGVLVGLALITAYLPIPLLRNLIGTPTMLLLGFVVVITPLATRAIEGGVLQISGELEESARVSGATKYVSFLTVVLPLVLPSFLSGWLIAGTSVAGNLSLPILLSSPTMQTTAVAAYDLYRAGKASQAAALFLVLMAAVAIVGCLAWATARYTAKLANKLRIHRLKASL